MPVNDKERYGAEIPADDPVRGAMYDNWEWRSIKAAITGYADMDANHGATVNNLSDPNSLYKAARAFWYVQHALEHVRETLDKHGKATAGDGGPWKGPAAQAFLGGIDQFGKLVQAQVDQLADRPSGARPVPQQLVQTGDKLAVAIGKIQSIDAWYANQASQMGARTFDHGDKGSLVHISEQQQAVDMMTRDMRVVIKELHSDYTVTATAMRPPPNSNFDLTKDPTKQDPTKPGVGAMPDLSGMPGVSGAGFDAGDVEQWPGGVGSPTDLGLAPDPFDPFDPATDLAGGLSAPGSTLPGFGSPAPWPGTGAWQPSAGGGVGSGLGGFPGITPFPGGGLGAPGAGARGASGIGAGGLKSWPGGAAGAAERAMASRLGAAGGPGASGLGGRGTAALPGGANGMGGYPYMPPMGGMGGPAGGAQERERTTWLVEDDDVWGADPADLAPDVIGRSH